MASSDVVIVGGGIVGMTTAYYLARAGVRTVVIERDAIGSHASGFAYGGLNPLIGFGIPGPPAEIAQAGITLHPELSRNVMEGIRNEYEILNCSLHALGLDETEARTRQDVLPGAPDQRR